MMVHLPLDMIGYYLYCQRSLMLSWGPGGFCCIEMACPMIRVHLIPTCCCALICGRRVLIWYAYNMVNHTVLGLELKTGLAGQSHNRMIHTDESYRSSPNSGFSCKITPVGIFYVQKHDILIRSGVIIFGLYCYLVLLQRGERIRCRRFLCVWSFSNIGQISCKLDIKIKCVPVAGLMHQMNLSGAK